MKNVVIIGAGFAGTSVVQSLARYHREINVTLIDKSAQAHFLPLIPDVIGRELPAQHLVEDIADLCTGAHAQFYHEEVTGIDTDKCIISTQQNRYPYDYLVIASGSQTNFYGNVDAQRRSFSLDNADDASRLAQVIHEGNFDTVVVAGAGYTGIEIATNIAVYFKKYNCKRRVVIVERQATILGSLPEWMKSYCIKNLQQLSIEILTDSVIEKVRDNEIVVSGDKTFANPLLVWAAGVRTADFLQQFTAEKNPQGRLKVDQYLRINERIFSVGDASLFTHGNGVLRMAVQFSIFEGGIAAGNIIRSIRKRPLRVYKPVDLGYIIPMAHNKGCGIVFGIPVRGVVAIFLHYCMCVFRLRGLRNKWGILSALIMPKQKGS